MNLKLIISKLISTLCFLLVCTFLVTGIYGCTIENYPFGKRENTHIEGDVVNVREGDKTNMDAKGNIEVSNDSTK